MNNESIIEAFEIVLWEKSILRGWFVFRVYFSDQLMVDHGRQVIMRRRRVAALCACKSCRYFYWEWWLARREVLSKTSDMSADVLPGGSGSYQNCDARTLTASADPSVGRAVQQHLMNTHTQVRPFPELFPHRFPTHISNDSFDKPARAACCLSVQNK